MGSIYLEGDMKLRESTSEILFHAVVFRCLLFLPCAAVLKQLQSEDLKGMQVILESYFEILWVYFWLDDFLTYVCSFPLQVSEKSC